MISFFKRLITLEHNVMGMNQRNIDLVYPNNDKKYYHLADDKIQTKSVLEKHGLACAETYGVIERISDIGQVWDKVKHHSRMAIKPANGSGGGGIKILKKDPNNGNWRSSGRYIDEEEIFKHFADIITGIYSLGGTDSVLIEYCIEPHPFFHEIYPAGVPDFRVILLEGAPLLAMLRLPTDRSDGKANLHQGGLGIGIDMQKGLLTQAHDGRNYHEVHPDTGSQIKSKNIPYWKETMALSVATAKAFPLGYLGIDIVIDKQLGPLVMEINVRPGLGIQLANRVGLKEVLRQIKNSSSK